MNENIEGVFGIIFGMLLIVLFTTCCMHVSESDKKHEQERDFRKRYIHSKVKLGSDTLVVLDVAWGRDRCFKLSSGEWIGEKTFLEFKIKDGVK